MLAIRYARYSLCSLFAMLAIRYSRYSLFAFRYPKTTRTVLCALRNQRKKMYPTLEQIEK